MYIRRSVVASLYLIDIAVVPLFCSFFAMLTKKYYHFMFQGILLKPNMVTPGAEHKEKASSDTIAKYTLTTLKIRVPPPVPGIMV